MKRFRSFNGSKESGKSLSSMNIQDNEFRCKPTRESFHCPEISNHEIRIALGDIAPIVLLSNSCNYGRKPAQTISFPRTGIKVHYVAFFIFYPGKFLSAFINLLEGNRIASARFKAFKR